VEISSYVIHKEDTKKIIYVVEKIFEDKVYISGLNYRIRRIVKPEDLILATEKQIEEENKQTEEYYLSVANITHRNNKSYLLGRVLHIDGDKKYLDKCLELYKAIGVYANGYETDEKSMALKVKDLLLALNPDILVITGHDVYNNKGTKDLNNYTNTTNYIEAVKKARQIKGRSDLVIIAGACQSNFEALIASGADFASSPKRINIHTFDPAVIAIKIASTSISKIVNLSEALRYIDNGQDAFGGLETFGKMRLFV
jgi:spore coat assembly protein